MAQPPRGRCYIVTLNWNGWGETLVCLESLFRLEYRDYVVVVCDNASTDCSVERIKSWARGDLDVADDTPPAVRALAHPPVPKPISMIEMDRAAAESGSCGGVASGSLILIHNGANGGCAKGLNVGLRFVQARGDGAYVWLINHDTLVEPKALGHLVELVARDPKIGLAGSTVRFAYAPEINQSLGGASFNLWTATGEPIGFQSSIKMAVDAESVQRRLHYVAGASMLASRAWLDEVGLIPEHFFLYFEEIAWAREARGRLRLGYAPESIVYHREGAATGSSTDDPAYGGFADRLMLRNRITFARAYAPWALPTVCLGLVFVFLDSLVRGRWKRARLLGSLEFWCHGTFAQDRQR